jgi:hypothetical protein
LYKSHDICVSERDDGYNQTFTTDILAVSRSTLDCNIHINISPWRGIRTEWVDSR